MSFRFNLKPNAISQGEVDATLPASSPTSEGMSQAQEDKDTLKAPRGRYTEIAQLDITQIPQTLRESTLDSCLILVSYLTLSYHAEQLEEWKLKTGHYYYHTTADFMVQMGLLTSFFCFQCHLLARFWVWKYFQQVSNPTYANFCSFSYMGFTGAEILRCLEPLAYLMLTCGVASLFGFAVFFFIQRQLV